MIGRYLRCGVAMCVAALIGCGGGGGATFTISEQNAEAVSGQGVAAVSFIEDMGALVEDYVRLVEEDESEVIDCVSGNAVVTVDDVGAQGILSTGDSVTVQFQACNIGLGIVSRAAPQLNIFAVGFPISLMMGFLLIWATLPQVMKNFGLLVNEAFDVAALMLGAG